MFLQTLLETATKDVSAKITLFYLIIFVHHVPTFIQTAKEMVMEDVGAKMVSGRIIQIIRIVISALQEIVTHSVTI